MVFFPNQWIAGSQCRFRHCEEALGSDTVCSLWREGKCLDPLCRFRHMEMQQNCSISCFWETQPLGCVKISCIFYHSKPRNINGLFLPPSSNITLQKETQEGISPPAQSQEPLKPQENISRPIHHPLVLKTNFEEEEEEGDEQNDASSLWTKTPEEIEEKRAIKEMCYKSGEYYRFHTPPDISSSKSIASTVEKELEKPLENGSELQEGDGLTVPTKFSLSERQGEIKASLDGKPRTDIAAFENGGGDCHVPQRIIFLGVDEKEVLTEGKEVTMSKCSNAKVNDVQPVRKPHFKGVKKRKWIYDEPKSFPGPGMRRAVQAPNPKNKMSYHRNHRNRNSENAAYIHVQKDAVKTVSWNAPPRGRPTNGSYNRADINKEPKFNLCSDKYTSTSYNGSAWRKRIPFSKTYSKTEKIYTEPRRNGSK
uniref:Zinc-finger CCCH domain-containing protein n=2 Tax=Sus scrofa TaxID=9823 RepID=A0A8D0XAA0_PIG